jgi:FkbM family methyltransferase
MNEAAPRYSLQVLSLLSRTFLRLARSLVDRFPTLAVAYRYVRDNRLGGYNPRDTPMGFRFAGNAGMESGTFEPVETALMGSVLRDSDVFVNVGANIGYYCCLALRTGAYVVAFEPMPGNLYWLYRNISANGWQQRAEIFPMALANRIGLVDIFGGATGASPAMATAGGARRCHRRPFRRRLRRRIRASRGRRTVPRRPARPLRAVWTGATSRQAPASRARDAPRPGRNHPVPARPRARHGVPFHGCTSGRLEVA